MLCKCSHRSEYVFHWPQIQSLWPTETGAVCLFLSLKIITTFILMIWLYRTWFMGRFVMFGRDFFINISFFMNRISGIQTHFSLLVGTRCIKNCGERNPPRWAIIKNFPCQLNFSVFWIYKKEAYWNGLSLRRLRTLVSNVLWLLELLIQTYI